MKKYIILLFCLAFILTGCTGKEMAPPKAKERPNSNHLTAQQDGVTIETSNELRSFPKSMIATKEGYDIVGLSVVVINKTPNNLPISPSFVTLEAVDGTKYTYSEVTSITGKGAFKEVTLPPDYRGGGLLLFEIKKDTKIDKVLYNDKSNHNITIKFESGDSSNV